MSFNDLINILFLKSHKLISHKLSILHKIFFSFNCIIFFTLPNILNNEAFSFNLLLFIISYIFIKQSSLPERKIKSLFLSAKKKFILF